MIIYGSMILTVLLMYVNWWSSSSPSRVKEFNGRLCCPKDTSINTACRGRNPLWGGERHNWPQGRKCQVPAHCKLFNNWLQWLNGRRQSHTGQGWCQINQDSLQGDHVEELAAWGQAAVSRGRGCGIMKWEPWSGNHWLPWLVAMEAWLKDEENKELSLSWLLGWENRGSLLVETEESGPM